MGGLKLLLVEVLEELSADFHHHPLEFAEQGSLLSTTGGATAKGVAWTGCVEAGGEGGVGVGSAGGEEGATLVLLVTRPSSVASSSSSSCTT